MQQTDSFVHPTIHLKDSVYRFVKYDLSLPKTLVYLSGHRLVICADEAFCLFCKFTESDQVNTAT